MDRLDAARIVKGLFQHLKTEGIIEISSGSVLRLERGAMGSGERAKTPIDFGAVVDALPGLVWTTQADGRSDFVNRGWREYTGLDLDEAIDHGWQRAIHPDDLTSFAQAWDLIRRSGVAKEIDARLRRSDGEYRWFVVRPSPLPLDDSHDQRWCWFGSFADEGTTTDERLRRLWDMLPFRSGFLDSALVLEWANRESRERTHDVTLKDLQEWRTSGVMLIDDLEKQNAKLAALLTKGEMYDNEVRMRHSDGSYRWARARAVPILDAHGNAVRYLSCQFDIHDLKQAEALLAAEVKLLEMVARGEPLRQVLDALSRHVEELASGCFCSILVVAPDRMHFEVGAGPSMPGAYNAILDGKTIDGGYGPCSLAVLDKAPIITADLASDPRWEGSTWLPLMKTFNYASCWSMPILSASGQASGVVAIYRRDTVVPKLQERDLIDRFTKIAGIAIDRARADEALHARETELRRSNHYLTEAQKMSLTGSFTWDPERAEQDWSEEMYRIWEFDREAPLDLSGFMQALHPDDVAAVEAELARAFEVGDGYELFYRIKTRSGAMKHLHTVGQRVSEVTDRKVFIGATQDVTNSREAEEALRASEVELRQTLTQLTDGQRLSRTGSFTSKFGPDLQRWSDELYRIYEIDPATPPSMEIVRERVHPDDLASFDAEIRQRVEGHGSDFLFRIVTPTGKLKHLHAVARPMEYVAGGTTFMGIVQDITESKLAEAALNQARSELAHVARVATLNAMTASIAHEVSQPLSGILTNANTCVRMLASDPPNLAGAVETARRTIRDANRATEVIQRLRAMFSTKSPTIEVAEINDLASEVIALSMGELLRNGALLQTDFAEELPHVGVDRVQLQQVILNLLLNAADAMAEVKDRPRTLLVQTGLHDDGSVKLLVRDSGTGVDPDTIERLFDAFYTTKSKGMGVGLSISRSIIERHDGRLWAEANEGPGATFSFCLPSLSAHIGETRENERRSASPDSEV